MSNPKPIHPPPHPQKTPHKASESPKLSALKSHPYIIGVDPGLNGAVCILEPLENQIVRMIDIPTFQIATKSAHRTSGFTRYVDTHQLAMEIDAYSPKVCFAVTEETNAAPHDGVASAFKFGLTSGQIWGVLAANYLPVFPIKPRAWKMALGLHSDKDASLAKAVNQWPKQKDLFRRKKDHDRAEAALIAWYGFKHIEI